ncbi:hypothetical protein E2C01_018142 [Portunus trituberculatus]|uniref:Uncharacterized protein n=1 Tax=Portunus trituberculatus TaxID=210409 RepID=A0A5B7DW02_PORTR|nr:hypothetical protein [Portunus trituberculatus]
MAGRAEVRQLDHRSAVHFLPAMPAVPALFPPPSVPGASLPAPHLWSQCFLLPHSHKGRTISSRFASPYDTGTLPILSLRSRPSSNHYRYLNIPAKLLILHYFLIALLLAPSFPLYQVIPSGFHGCFQ